MSTANQAVATEVPPALLLAGFGAANRAVARSLLARGHSVTVFDDNPDAVATAAAHTLGLELEVAPDDDRLVDLVRAADMAIPTPGLPDHHPVLAAASTHNVPLASELDLARKWDSRPIAAVTGTSGKTSTTELVVAALEASGRAALAAGNTDAPLVSAIDRTDIEVFVVEASSFRLARSSCFAPRAGCWLNFAPDHLDVHRDLASYEAAKARLWDLLPTDGVAVANRQDPVVMGHVPANRTVHTFAASGPADWHLDGGELKGPDGTIVATGQLRRALPHDIGNALAAAATAVAVGATYDGLREALSAFEPAAHRVQRIASIDGVVYYDDSKATTPHATVAALRCFDAAVLVAGGRNKGLDLRNLLDAVGHVHAVVALGEAAQEIAEVFAGVRTVLAADNMEEAVTLAAAAAEPSMAVLLSPACASFDSYADYAARGDDFTRIVTERAEQPLAEAGRR